MYNYKAIGFVNSDKLRNNEIYSLYISLFPEQKTIFSKTSVQVMFELEHFHNMVLLLLILEIDVCLHQLELSKHLLEVQQDMSDLKALRLRILRILRILRNVSTPLRSSLSSNLLSFQNKMLHSIRYRV